MLRHIGPEPRTHVTVCFRCGTVSLQKHMFKVSSDTRSTADDGSPHLLNYYHFILTSSLNNAYVQFEWEWFQSLEGEELEIFAFWIIYSAAYARSARRNLNSSEWLCHAEGAPFISAGTGSRQLETSGCNNDRTKQGAVTLPPRLSDENTYRHSLLEKIHALEV